MIIEVEFDTEDTSIEEAIVSNWFVEEGELVDEGDALVELATEDDTIEIKASCSGSILELRVEEDETIRVGDVLCMIDTDEAMDYATDEDDDDAIEDE